MIGASAIANGLQLITRDKRSFAKIPGLPVQLW
jgi:predicted nucleic acid-binding protein